MKDFFKSLCVITIAILLLASEALMAQGLVSQWGKDGSGSWPILNTATTPAGDAGMGDGKTTASWSTLMGQFPVLQATTTQAVVVTGKLQLVGGGGADGYTHLRYALTLKEDATLNNAGTDTAKWTSAKTHFGYSFHPRSGTGTMSNGRGGAGTVWLVDGGGFNSGWGGNNTAAVGKTGNTLLIDQAPRNAQMIEGKYNFAISVKSVNDTTNEVKWYLVEESNKYWFAGTELVKSKTKKFNSIAFGVNNDSKATQFNVMSVKAELGTTITIPEKPFIPFYVAQWGSTSRGSGWPILNDSTYLDGNAAMGSDGPPKTWATIRGQFPETVVPTLTKAIVVSGKFEYVGGGPGASYVPLRYALTYTANGVLTDANKPTASWSATTHVGYQITPRSGAADLANGGGGSGTLWTIPNHLGWNSTYNGGKPIYSALQAPRNAELTAGVYNWAISVKPLANGTTEIRYFIEKEHAANKQTDYWLAGIAVDSSNLATQFNGVAFGVGDGITTTMKQFNLIDVFVEMKDPITIPEKPFLPFYVGQWGATSRGSGWPILNDATYIDGNAAMGSDGPPKTWATIRGQFPETVTPTKAKAIVVSGKFEYVGGGPGASYVPLRYALTYTADGVLSNPNTPTALWSATTHVGYQITPRSGAADLANGGGGSGTLWTIPNHLGWNSTYNGGVPIYSALQAPRNAELTAGVYDWAISVQPLENGTTEIRYYIVKEHAAGKQTDYWLAGTAIDPNNLATKFNGIAFGVGDGITTTMKQFNLIDVYVEMKDPITIPEKPFAPYYVSDWGFIGNRVGGWELTPGEVTGNVTISGENPLRGWAAVRGAFEDTKPTKAKALRVTGQFELEGGGFEPWSSLRIGLYYTNKAGKIDAATHSWNGTETGSNGYLFIPHSGDNELTTWYGSGEEGTVGAIVNGTWFDTADPASYVLAATKQKPARAYARAGVYNFELSVAPTAYGGANDVRFNIYNKDKSYVYSGALTDNHSPLATEMFNSISFALNTNTKPIALKLYDVFIDLGNQIEASQTDMVSVDDNQGLPTEFALEQNYPNPFNPSTTIGFALPKSANVNLVVYDVLGRVVSELANGEFDAGTYNINFNASQLSSGIYFYKLTAGDFVSVKKLMLLK